MGPSLGVPELLAWLQQFPLVWVQGNPPGLAVVELVGHAKPVHLRQYPVTVEAGKRIKLHVQRLLQA